MRPMLRQRIEELARDQARPGPRLYPRGGAAPPGGGGSLPLTAWDPLSDASATPFAWDVTDAGWDTGAWCGQTEWLGMRLDGSLLPWRGAPTVTFTRAGTTTRTNDSGGTDTVAANSPAFDWVEGPRGDDLWALRCDQAAALLTASCRRWIRRREGAISMWIRPQWGGASELFDRILWQSGTWQLIRSSGDTNLTWSVGISGVPVDAYGATSAWIASTWHLVIVDWSRADAEIRIWLDGSLSDTTATGGGRLDALDDAMGIGQGAAAGDPANCHVWDFRVWPVRATASLATLLWSAGRGETILYSARFSEAWNAGYLGAL